jgi:hypothetical protein
MLNEHVMLVCAYVKQLPGFDRICMQGIATIIRNRSFAMLSMRTAHVVADGESYLMLSDSIQLTKKLILKMGGTEVTHRIFNYHNRLNRLNLSNYELATLCPMILSLPGFFMS